MNMIRLSNKHIRNTILTTKRDMGGTGDMGVQKPKEKAQIRSQNIQSTPRLNPEKHTWLKHGDRQTN